MGYSNLCCKLLNAFDDHSHKRTFRLHLALLLFISAIVASHTVSAQSVTLDGNPSDWAAVQTSSSILFKTFATDPYNSSTDDRFTGSGSRDNNNISSWQWNQLLSPYDDYDIENAGLALIGRRLYFFCDRYDNDNYDASLGFWILKNKITKTGTTSGAFSGVHANGDLLITMDFTGGHPIRHLYKWSSGSLVEQTLSTTALDIVCNSSSISSSPFTYTPYFPGTGLPAGTYPARCFLEGFVNIDSVGGDICFSGFNVSTRLTQSTNDTYMDMLNGVFSPRPIVDIADDTVCSGPAVFTAVVTGGTSPLTYSWNSTAYATASTYTISPVTVNTFVTTTVKDSNGCISQIDTGRLVVPVLTVNAIPGVSRCNGASGSVISFSSPTSGVTFAWISSANVGFGISGTGSIGAYTAAITGTSPVVATVSVTATAYGCTGPPTTFNVTVYPVPNVVPHGDSTYTKGSPASALSFTGSVSGTTYTWTSTTNVGFGTSGTGNIPAYTTSTSGGPSTIVATVIVTPSINGCTGTRDTFLITLNPVPNVLAHGDSTYCPGVTAPPITFSGGVGGTMFNWTSSVNVGFGTSGVGAIPAYTTITTGSTAIIATVTVMPSASASSGVADTFLITIKANPNVAAHGDSIYCKGVTAPGLTFAGSVSGTTFTWTSTTNVGFGTSGTGNIPAYTTTNGSSTPIITTVIVVPAANGCTGTRDTFLITIYPSPNVVAHGDSVYCSGVTAPPISFTGSVSGTTFTWISSDDAGFGMAGTGSIPSYTTITTDPTAPHIVRAIVTPTANGCVGIKDTFLITVKASPDVDPHGDLVYCKGITAPALTFTGSVATTTFTWTSSVNVGFGTSGTGNIGTYLTVNSGSIPVTATVIVTPAASGCPGIRDTFLITVSPALTVVAHGDSTYCPGVTAPPITFTGSIGGTTFTWTSSDDAGFGLIGTGSIPAYTTVTTDATPLTVRVIVTPTAGGCVGVKDTFLITIKANPDVDAHGDFVYCTGVTAPALTFTGGVAGSTFTWTSSLNVGFGTNGIGNIGTYTAVNSGTTPITTTVVVTPVAGGCIGTKDTFLITINPLPNAGTITGTPTVCAGNTTTLINSVSGGTWSSDIAGVATINAVGIVTGISAGTAVISYSVTNSCGTAVETQIVTVNPLPNAGTITGTSTVCVGNTTSLSSSVSGGSWSTGAAAIATVSTGGIVTGVSAGTAVISYSVTNSCGTAIATQNVTVNPLPNAGIITGTATVCVGNTTSLSNSVSGGSWSTGGAAIATVSTGGIVTGVAAGTVTISYSVTNSCGTAIATQIVTVNPLPNAGTITGTATVCVGNTTSLSNSVSGGSWSTGGAAIATVSTGGVVTGVAAGTATISYSVTNSCGTAVETQVVTVNPLPNAGTITGTPTVCAGSTTTLSNSVSGGSWSSGAAGIASISAGGIVTGVSAGTAMISYNVANSCGTAAATQVVTVNPIPGAGTITGTPTVCVGNITSLSSSVSSGSWSSSAASIATVSAGSIVTGVSAGTAVISYSVTNSCGTAVETQVVTVNPLPSAGTITGTSTVCVGNTTSLSSSVSGGSWSSGAAGIATVSASGIVTGISAGTAVISYSVTNTCGTAVETQVVTVNPLPNAGTITGTSIVCVGNTTSLSSSVSGGSWSTGAAGIATVSTGGIVTGVSAGTAMISYSVTNSCGTAVETQFVTVNPLPNAGTITGTSTVCAGNTTSLSNAASGGSWSSGAASIATVSPGGIVTGVSAGTAVISYSVTNSCGTAATTQIVTVNPLPNAGIITGTATVCVGNTTSLSNSVSGGSWSSGAASIATVSPGGIVTGVSAGTAVISYTVTNSCGTAVETQVVTVNPLPDAGTITGIPSVTAGGTTTLTDAVSGGIWSSSTPAIAIISAGGVVSGVSPGTSTISYSVTNSCGTAITTIVVTVNPLTDSINGVLTTCVGNTTSLTSGTSGGTWNSSNIAIATVSATGLVTGIIAGTATISYTVFGSVNTVVVTVIPLPVAGTITGTSTVCAGNTTSLSSSTTGGSWSSGAAGIATVSTGGVVTGVAAGTATISYSVTNSCGTAVETQVVTVNPLPNAGTITGTPTVCVGNTISLSNSASDGSWISGAAGIATVSAGGVVTGIAPGTTLISYTVTNSCGTAAATQIVTVNPLPNAGTITGTPTVCVGNTTSLSNAVSGGSWSSGAAGSATVSAGGVVTGVAAGTATISYSVTNSCGTAVATQIVTVNPLPNAGTITGTATVCAGNTTSLSSSTTGGSWSSGAAGIATVSTGGVVTGVSAGTTVISYTVTNSCGTAVETQVVTVNPLPNAGTITGTPTVCAGNTTSLSNSASVGSWSTGAAAIATVSTGGIVTGVAAGTVTISYAVTNSCGTAIATQIVTVNPLPNAGTITGTATLCAGNTTALSSSVSGGSWSSGAAGIATVSAGGVVTGVAAGTAVISYAVTNGCGTAVATFNVTVNPLPDAGTITGIPSVTAGGTTTLTDAVSGGTWSSSTPAIATISTSGVVSGVSPGTSTISYSVTNSCGTVIATIVVTVNPLTDSINGVPTTCVGNTTSLTSGTSGGTWNSSNTAIAIVSAAGVVTGVSAGTATISYTVFGSVNTVVVTVIPLPVAGTITGTPTLCAGSTTSLSSSVSGGSWSTGAAGIATVSAGGVVTGLAAGTAVISYTVTNSCGTAVATQVVTVNPLPNAGIITGTTTVCVGNTTSLSSSVSGGSWSSGAAAIATVSTGGIITGVSAGTTVISYSVTNSCGTAIETQVVTVNPLPNAGTITGTPTVCAGNTTSLSNSASGGSWSSGAVGIATVSAAGVVTGVAAGTTVISYSVTNSCGTAIATQIVTVGPLPDAGTITGIPTVCTGNTTSLSGSVSGGSWSTSAAGIATVSAGGVVTGVAAGTLVISYSVTNSCGTAVATFNVTVNPLPDAGTITGIASAIAGGTTTLTDAVSGGIWSSSTPAIAIISAGGVVSGVSPGTSTISYSVTNSCGTATATIVVTVVPLTDSISGVLTTCVGSTTSLIPSTPGGTWNSSNTAIATVSATGAVTGVSAGTATISYTVFGSVNTVIVTINPLPVAGTITGTPTICAGNNTTLSSSISGGSWSTGAAGIATVSAGGIVTGLAASTAVISYTVTNSCGTAVATQIVTVNPLPNAGIMAGTATVCAGNTTSLSSSTTGGFWSSGAAGIATVSTGGVVTGVSAGTATISYSVTNSCGTAVETQVVTVNPLPNAGIITGTATICVGNTTSLSNFVSGGSWSTGAAGIATVNASGVVTGVSAGTAVISYSVTNTCGTAVETQVVTVNPLPDAGTITGIPSVTAGGTTTLSDAVSGGTWSSSTPAIATVSTSGVVSGVSPGTSTISYSVTNSCGTAIATIVVTVNPLTDSINGVLTTCVGNTTSLTSGTSGGTWNSSNIAIATVSATGLVTGISAGTATISYTVFGSVNTVVVTVIPLPVAGTITGTPTLCAGSTTSLSSSVSGGAWSSGTPGIATVSAGGVVTGVATGTATISYSVTNSCGTAAATQIVTVNPLPNAGTITGTSTVCAGNTTSLSNSASVGFWSSGAAGIATVSAGGIVTGLAAGTAVISYTVTNSCGTAVATQVVTVNPLPNAGIITGTTTVCVGNTTSLSNSVSGGSWSTGAAGIATVSAGGIVTGLAAGTAVISYTVTNSCGTAVATQIVTVNPLPNAGIMAGTATVCVGNTTSLSSSVSGGSWSSGAAAIATVSTGGIITGVSAGTTVISYSVTNSCGTAVETQVVTVNPLPNAGTITGIPTVCAGNTTSLSNSASGGSWSSGAVGIATASAAGVVTGVAAGTAVISYSVTNSCGTAIATQIVTVGPLPDAGTITGIPTVCTGNTTSLSGSVSGGSWSTSAAGIATVSAGGVVTGVAAGTLVISYSVTNSCGTAVATFNVTVNPLPDAGTITGIASAIAGGTTTLTDAVSGGIWSSSTPAIAIISAGGVVSGVSPGTSTISYSVTNSCGAAIATIVVTVVPLTDSISGVLTTCVGNTTSLIPSTPGGTWNSSNIAIATVSAAGVVIGISAGTATISYTVFGSVNTVVVTVNPLPNAGTITGTPAVCAGNTTTLSSSASGGSWSSGAAGIATVSAAGIVTGVSAGTAMISYNVTNSCSTAVATQIVTVNPLPNAGTITGTPTVCVGNTTSLSSSVSGGAWSSGAAGIATVSAGGVVTGVAAGTATISYSVTNSCGTAVAIFNVTVNPLLDAGTITGIPSVVAGGTTTLSDAASGGIWSSSTPAIATVSASGVVSGVSPGTSTISYSATNSCGTATATIVVTVNPLTDSINGVSTTCVANTTSLTSGTSGGTWNSSNTAIATVSAAGVVTGVSAGTTTISYTVFGSVNTVVVTVIPLPNAGTITGTPTICAGNNTTLSSSISGGSWSTGAAGIATVSAGVVTGVAAGTAVISYTVTNSCGTAVATQVVTVNPLPNAGTITGTPTVCAGSTTSLSSSVSGGIWSSGATGIATLSAAGVVTGVAAGTATISYSVTNSCGTAVVTFNATVNPLPDAGTITGIPSAVAGGTTTLSDAASGGIWSSSTPAIAIISAGGVVSGVSPGTSTISYSVTNSCGAAIATIVVTVVPLTDSISGVLTTCVGNTTSLIPSTPSGTWNSSNTVIATVSAAGVVTGISAGTATISYTVFGSVNTVIVTINPLPVAGTITGTSSVCPGSTTSLSSSAGGGTWSTSAAGIASVSVGGIVTGVASGTAMISYTVTNSCGIAEATQVVTVNPIPGVVAHNDTTYCNGQPASAINFTGAVVGATFNWTSSANVGFGTNGTGNISAYVATNASLAPVAATVITTPTANGCIGTPDTFLVTVNSNPTMTPVANRVHCNGDTAGIINFTGGAAGATFTWTSNTNVGFGTSGAGSIGSYAATNGGVMPAVATVTVTPGTSSCPGAIVTFNVTVNPTPSVADHGDSTYCAGIMASGLNFSGAVAGTAFNWTSSTNVGFGTMGTGNIPAYTALNGGLAPVITTVIVTPSSAGCTGITDTFLITVNPGATTNPVANRSHCAGDAGAAIAFSSSTPGMSFTWTSSLNVGFGTGGSGNIGAYTAVNTGSAPAVATVTVTPGVTGCGGGPITFIVTVNPTPDVVTHGDSVYCKGTLAPGLNFTGSVGSSTFAWTASANVGFGTGSTGSIGSYTAANPGSTLLVTTVIVTPSANGCAGSQDTFRITVNPAPTVAAHGDSTYCAGVVAFGLNFSGSIPGSAFNWTSSTNVGFGTSGTGNIPAYTALNGASVAAVATVIVTPSAAGCTGSADTFRITVNPTSTTNPVANRSHCAGAAGAVIAFSGSTPGITYTWTSSLNVGFGTGGTANIGAYTALNTGSTPVVATVTVTPGATGCGGGSVTFMVTVNPTPNVVPHSDSVYCKGILAPGLNFTGASGTTFAWTSSANVGFGLSGTGNISPYITLNPGSTDLVATMTVTPTANGCTGAKNIFLVTVKPTPVVYAHADTTYCSGDSAAPITFGTSTAATSFTWISTANVGFGTSGYGNIAAFTATGGSSNVTAAVIATPSTSGCTGANDTFLVTVKPRPADPAYDNITVCSGAPVPMIDIKGTDSVNIFTWSGSLDAGFGTSGSGNIDPFTAIVNPGPGTQVGIVTVYVTSPGGCSSMPAKFSVTVLPELTVVARDTICSGMSICLIPLGIPAGGTWSGPGVMGDTFNSSGLAVGTYKVYYNISNGGCTASDSANITVSDYCVVYGAYTQDVYARPRGEVCDGTGSMRSSTNLIDHLLNLGGQITVGRPGRSVIIPADAAPTVNAVLPGRNIPFRLTWPGDITISNAPGSLFDTKYLAAGELENSMLGEQITMKLNIRMSPGLVNFPIKYTMDSDSYFQTYAAQQNDCTFSCDNNNPVCFGIKESVAKYLTRGNTQPATLSDLVDLADNLLGDSVSVGDNSGGYIVPSYADVTSALSSINNAFNYFRTFKGIYGGCDTDVVANNDTIDLIIGIYPNPTNGAFTIAIQGLENDAHVAAYDVLGRHSLLNATIPASPYKQKMELEMPIDAARGVYLIRIETGGKVYGRKLVVN